MTLQITRFNKEKYHNGYTETKNTKTDIDLYITNYYKTKIDIDLYTASFYKTKNDLYITNFYETTLT